MFFGAGNLILPPLLGLQAAAQAPAALAGFLVAGIGLPVLAIVAVALAGDARALASRVNPHFAAAFIALVYLTIGPFLAIPRTSSTAYAMIQPLVPPLDGATSGLVAVAFSIAFFACAFALSLKPSMLSKVLGRVSGPALIALIVLVVAGAAVDPQSLADVGAPVAPYDQNAAAQGFLNGYQTMDLLAGLCFGIVVAVSVRDLGVSKPAHVAGAISAAGVIAGLLMMLVYCGLGFVGMSAGNIAAGATNGAEVLSASAGAHFGPAGTVIVAAIFLIACLNVCTGLVSCCAEYFSNNVGKLPRWAWSAAFAAFSCAVSLLGLDTILAFSAPLLGVLYPPAIVLVTMGLFHRLFDRMPKTWPWAVLVTCAVGAVAAARDAFAPGMQLPIDALPLASIGLEWVVPALVALAVGVFHSALAKGKR